MGLVEQFGYATPPSSSSFSCSSPFSSPPSKSSLYSSVSSSSSFKMSSNHKNITTDPSAYSLSLSSSSSSRYKQYPGAPQPPPSYSYNTPNSNYSYYASSSSSPRNNSHMNPSNHYASPPPSYGDRLGASTNGYPGAGAPAYDRETCSSRHSTPTPSVSSSSSSSYYSSPPPQSSTSSYPLYHQQQQQQLYPSYNNSTAASRASLDYARTTSASTVTNSSVYGSAYASGKDSSSEREFDDPKKQHKCSYCGKEFLRRHDMERHIRTHTHEQPYVCDNCGRAFSRSDALSRHYRSESACKPC